MSTNLKQLIIEALKDQAAIFGDDLYVNNLIDQVKDEPKENGAGETVSLLNLGISDNKYAMEDNKEKEQIEYNEDWAKSQSLDEFYDCIKGCMKCELGATRNKLVFGSGDPNVDIMVIGEGPGADEDAQGLPFVGRAGKLLTDILRAINFERDDVYIANIVKCRPPGNRNPATAEMDSCYPYLLKQIELIKPKMILCLGLVSGSKLLNSKLSLTKMRGELYDFHGAKLMVTFHPAALLRNPNWKRGCWEDVQKFRKYYDENFA